MKGDITNQTPVIIRADLEPLQPHGDPDGDQEGSAVLWLFGALFGCASVVIIMAAAWVMLQVAK